MDVAEVTVYILWFQAQLYNVQYPVPSSIRDMLGFNAEIQIAFRTVQHRT